MPRKHVLFFSVSGQRFTQRSALYKKLELLVRKEFPEQSFAFLGNPLRKLVFPLKWRETEKALHPTTKLLECWAALNQFCCTTLLPTLNDPGIDVVVTDGFGLDGLLYSTACMDNADANAQAWRLHSSLVDIRLGQQSISAPEYIITVGDYPTVNAVYERHEDLRALPESLRRDFIAYEEATIRRYFSGQVQHQHQPSYIPAGESVDVMAGRAIDFIRGRIETTRRQAA